MRRRRPARSRRSGLELPIGHQLADEAVQPDRLAVVPSEVQGEGGRRRSRRRRRAAADVTDRPGPRPVRDGVRGHIEMFTRPASIAPGFLLTLSGMPEELNVEVASTLAENAAIEADTEAQAERARWRERVEIIEAILLAAVAIATAWSGYQAARWDGRQPSCTDTPRRSGSRRTKRPPWAASSGSSMSRRSTPGRGEGRRRRGSRRALRAAVQPGVRSGVRRMDRGRRADQPERPQGRASCPSTRIRCWNAGDS